MTVTSLDLRPGGHLIYLMTAVAPEPVAFMKRAGMPLTSEFNVTYIEVSPPSRAGLQDFGGLRAWRRALRSRHRRSVEPGGRRGEPRRHL